LRSVGEWKIGVDQWKFTIDKTNLAVGI